MGLFSKKKKEIKKEVEPSLPELPKLPEFNSQSKPHDQIHQLPSFPSNSFGDKFSQDSIKDAVSGRRGGKEDIYADDFQDEMMQEPLHESRMRELDDEVEMEEMSPMERRRFKSSTMETGSIFIRIDKFEEGLRILNETKRKISEVEHTLSEIKHVREREEEQLSKWEHNIDAMKNHIDKVDQNIFSRV